MKEPSRSITLKTFLSSSLPLLPSPSFCLGKGGPIPLGTRPRHEGAGHGQGASGRKAHPKDKGPSTQALPFLSPAPQHPRAPSAAPPGRSQKDLRPALARLFGERGHKGTKSMKQITGGGNLSGCPTHPGAKRADRVWGKEKDLELRF